MKRQESGVRNQESGVVGCAARTGRSESRIIAAVEEYLAALESGNRPDREQFLARHADIADALAECLGGLEFVQAGAGHLSDSAGKGLGVDSIQIPLATPLGDYRIIRELGRGGMGVVYEAEQLSLERRVALKVLPFAAALDSTQLQRFRTEAHAAAHLHHTNIVPVYSVGCARGVHYYAMQFIEGHALAAIIGELRKKNISRRGAEHAEKNADQNSYSAPSAPLREVSSETSPVAALSTLQSTKDPLFFRTVAQLGIQAAEGLEHAHGLGIMHRDIKPGNLLVDMRGNLWITDFGLARVRTGANLTMTGDVLGTLRYMSPEQALAKRVPVDHRTDIYSLGVTLYELLTLEPALNGKDREEILRQIALDEPQPPRRLNKAIPAELETIVLKAMAKGPEERYATAQELATDLRHFLEDRPIKAKRPTLIQRTRKWARRHKAATRAALCVAFVMLLALGVGAYELRQISGFVVSSLTDAQTAIETGDIALAQRRLAQAEGRLGNASRFFPRLAARVADLRADADMVERVEKIRLETSGFTDHEFVTAASEYAQAFQGYGIDVESLEVAEAARAIRSRRIQPQLVAAIDHWAMICEGLRGPKESTWKHLFAVARVADPDEWRTPLRAALERFYERRKPQDRTRMPRDQEAEKQFKNLADSIPITEAPVSTVILLAHGLAKTGALEEAIAILRNAQHHHRNDFWINYDLAYRLHQLEPRRLDDTIRYYTAALAIRPQSTRALANLGVALQQQGRLDEAIAAYREAVRIRPDFGMARGSLGIALLEKGEVEEAVKELKESVRLAMEAGGAKPDKVTVEAIAHRGAAEKLRDIGKPDDAIAEFKEALRLQPNLPEVHCHLGLLLQAKGQLTEALQHLERGHELGSKERVWLWPSAQWVEDCKRLILQRKRTNAESKK